MHSLEENKVAHFIRNLRIRLWIHDSFQSAVFISVIFLTAFLLAPLFKGILREQFQVSLKIISLFILLIFVWRIIVLSRSNLNQGKFYQSLKHFFPPDLIDEIYSAEEFLKAMSGPSEPLFAPELAYAHIEKVKKDLEGIDKKRIPVLSSRSISIIRAGGILLFFILLIDRFSGIYKNTLSALLSPIPTPSTEIVDAIDINYIYPAYTGLPAVELKNTDGNIRALKGTTANLKVLSKIEADRCEILLDSGERFPMKGIDKNYTIGIVLERSGEYYIECKDGRRFIKDISPRSITVDEDEGPVVDAYLIGGQETISGGDKISFSYTARDDFGVQKVLFSCESSAGEQYTTIVKEPSIVSKYIKGEYLWNTANMNLKKGSEITCRLSALDNDTISGPKEGSSQVFRFRVGALDKRERFLDELRALFEDFVNLLADVLEREDKRIDTKFIVDLNRELSHLRTKSREVLNTFTDIQGKATEILNKTIVNLDAISIELKKIQSKNRIEKRDLGSITEKLEDAVLEIYTLIKLGRYELLMNTAEDILSLEQALLEKFKDGKAQELYKRIEELEKKIAEMFSAIASGASTFSEEFINIDALKERGSLSLFDKLNKIKSLLQQGRTEEARKLYEEFMSEYAKFVAGMQEFFSTSTLKDFSEFMGKLQGLHTEVKELISREAKITSALKDSEPRMSRDIHEWLMREIEKVNQLINKIDAMQKITDSINLQEARRRAELIRISLSAFNLFDALREARATLGSLERMQLLPEGTRDERMKSELNSSMALNREIINDIEDVLRNLSSRIDEKSKQKLKDLSREQEGIERRTRELSSEIQKLQSENEFMKTPIPDMLSGAADFMKGARNRMEDGDPAGGFQNASEALRELGKIDDYIENMKSGGAMAMPFPLFGHRGYGSGYGSSIGRVELPGEQESAYQREIKEELLKAIRGGLPEKLEEENRKYIKELMK